MAAGATSTQNKLWAADQSQYGFQMLEKMGWSQGKGLGRFEQGDSSHVKMMRKLDTSGIGAKKDSTGNTTLTTGLLDFHRLLMHLGETHKDGSPQVELPESTSEAVAWKRKPEVMARIRKGITKALEASSDRLPSTAAASASDSSTPLSDDVLLEAMELAAFVGGGGHATAKARKIAKRARAKPDAAAAAGKHARKAATGAAKLRQSYRRSIRNKNVSGYSKHDLSAIFSDAGGAHRAPTAAERDTSNAAAGMGEGLADEAAEAAAHVLATSHLQAGSAVRRHHHHHHYHHHHHHSKRSKHAD